VSDPHPTRPPSGKRGFFERLVEFVVPGPDSRDELIEALADAEQRELIEPESRAMLEGVIRMADMTAGDAMVAAPRMDLLDIDARPLAVSRLRGQARERHRHPARERPSQAAARARAQPAHAAAAGRVRA
jgi:Mg2+/Co2+ transporter CorC